MERITPKPLHKGKCIEDLRDEFDVNFKRMPFKLLCKSLPKLIQQADVSRLEGDEEQSYILYMKFISLVQYIRANQHDEYCAQSLKKVNRKDVVSALDRAEALKKSLEKRYEAINEQSNSVDHDQPFLNLLTSNGPGSENPSLITPQLLFRLLSEKKKVLIFDIRKPFHFSASHIALKNSVVNIPGDSIVRGISVAALSRTLPLESKMLWDKRGLVDVLVLVDWYDTSMTHRSDSTLCILRDILMSDPIVQRKKPPVILLGGYSGWLSCYPKYTTNPKVLSPCEVEVEIKKMMGSNSKGFISSTSLYDLMTKEVRVLLLDIRNESDYRKSHISLKKCILNVPDTVIQHGTYAASVYRSLPDESKVLWDTRGVVDLLVLIDWSTSIFSYSLKSAVFILKDILMKWDPDVEYEREPVVLDGGYEDWLFRYPTYTTNPRVKPPSKTDREITDLLVTVEYPSLIEEPVKLLPARLTPTVDRSVKPNSLPALTNMNDSSETESSPPSSHSLKESSRSLSVESLISTLPAVDRTAKAAALELYKEKEEKMEKLLKVADDSLKLEKNRLEAEEEWEKLRMHREREAEEEMRLELQEREAKLLDKIQNLEKLQNEKEMENQNLRRQLDLYRKREEQQDSSSLDSPEKKQEEEMNAQIQSKEEEKKKIATKREEMVTERESWLFKRQVPKSRASTPTRTPEGTDKGSVERSKLKDTPPNYSPIKRSHSFLNISNEEEERATYRPKFDRTIKPLTPPQAAEVRAARNRDFSPCLGSKGLGLTGLKNLGNTCYMNSIIQCLSHTEPFSAYLCNRMYMNVISSKNGRAEIVEEVAAVIEAMWNHQFRHISMKDLKRVVGQKKAQFNTKEQQDSSEFLTLLMDWLHEDLKHSPSTKKLSHFASESEKEWEAFYNKNASIVVDLFYGQQKSTVTCLMCKKASITFETFSNLTLPLPSKRNKCTLETCVQLYLEGEHVTGWNCPSCKEPRDAMKKFDILKLPPILIIHLKRFSIDGWFRKKQTMVEFPLTGFNMLKYIQGRTENVSFELYGVSNHHGHMEGGHYTAFCKSCISNLWYKFDDQDINELHPADVVSSAAYILFYKSISS